MEQTKILYITFYILQVVFGDPCSSYKLINSAGQRGTNCISSTLICDRNGFNTGWYAAVYDGQFLEMSETSPEPFTCGTERPIWIGGKHPTVIGSNVTVPACVRGAMPDETCMSSFNVTIMKCSTFYVYHLPFVDLCFLGYCFGNHSCEIKTTTSTPAQDTSTTTTVISPTDPCIYASNLPQLGHRGSECSSAKTDNLLCDRTLTPGWYKAIDDNMFHDMPSTCVKEAHCGTEEPIWLNGTLPTFTDGAVARKACVRGLLPGECCKKTIDIFVRNCFTYNVYYLPYTDLCFRAYCFGNRDCQIKNQGNGPSNAKTITDDKTPYIVAGSVVGTAFIIFCAIVVVCITKPQRKVERCKDEIICEPPPVYSLKPVVYTK